MRLPLGLPMADQSSQNKRWTMIVDTNHRFLCHYFWPGIMLTSRTYVNMSNMEESLKLLQTYAWICDGSLLRREGQRLLLKVYYDDY